jgi:hypothetical protein
VTLENLITGDCVPPLHSDPHPTECTAEVVEELGLMTLTTSVPFPKAMTPPYELAEAEDHEPDTAEL